uniref:diphosphoinositol-polyphosphate diphosphatase n=1 Tax=Scylla olivacea TaxID=85551 RepID=A0A0P4WER8_SCYOL
MHSQVTPGSLAVSTIEDITAPRRYSTESLCLDAAQLLYNSAAAPSCAISNRLTPAATSSNSQQYFDFSTSGTTTGANNCTDVSLDTLSPPQSSNLWTSKSMSKCNTNSRGSLTSKGKGVCCGRRRLIDEEGFIRRAACVCVNKDESQVLLVTSKKDPCVWLVPGGGLEVGEEAIVAAQREAWEEAGIQGVVKRFLGLFESCHHSGTKKHRTAVFVFMVSKEHKDFPEARLGRRRRWFSLEEALLLLARHRPLQSAYLQLLMMSKLKMTGSS